MHMATSTTQWDRPTAAPTPIAPVAAPAPAPVEETKGVPAHAPVRAAAAAMPAHVESGARKAMSSDVKLQWKKILDYARLEATSKIANKNKKFFGLRKFAEVATRRKAAAANKKIVEAAEEAEAAKAAEAGPIKKSSKAILSFLEVEMPKVEKMNIEEFAESSFELNRKGLFGSKTTVTKVLSWKNVSAGGTHNTRLEQLDLDVVCPAQ